MCAIFGVTMNRSLSKQDVAIVRSNLRYIIDHSKLRGRDGFGYRHIAASDVWDYQAFDLHNIDVPKLTVDSEAVIGNFRAEPTTEYVREKNPEDQQPYTIGRMSIVHNGTIANDASIRNHRVPTSIDSASIVEWLSEREFYGLQTMLELDVALYGSYAILVNDGSGSIFALCNYRPIWYAQDKFATYFGSSRDAFPRGLAPQMLTPYSVARFQGNRIGGVRSTRQRGWIVPKVLAVCSGGLDSVVAATQMVRDGHDVKLIHFEYGSRAEGPEVRAVRAVAEELNVPVVFFPMDIYNPQDSPLLQADSSIAGGEEGAEFAHEWVPARNLVMLSLATAYAEAKGFDMIMLGNNLEEAGAYPDNEPEFIDRFNDILPFAVADGKEVRVIMPVGNLMKHEIVKLGHELNAPLDKTWSCYRAGERHCGTCGPCFMRRTAFKINGLDEVITYEETDA